MPSAGVSIDFLVSSKSTTLRTGDQLDHGCIWTSLLSRKRFGQPGDDSEEHLSCLTTCHGARPAPPGSSCVGLAGRPSRDGHAEIPVSESVLLRRSSVEKLH
ncbi:hypothetical protein BsWGS_06876 [Bradybaena similaris]